MNSGRIRCSSCKIDYNPFFDTGFSRLRIGCVSWLLLIKLFEIEVSARKASIQLGLSYPTTLKGFDILRGAILQELSRSDEVLKGEIEADESYFGGKTKRKKRQRSRRKNNRVWHSGKRRQGETRTIFVYDMGSFYHINR